MTNVASPFQAERDRLRETTVAVPPVVATEEFGPAHTGLALNWETIARAGMHPLAVSILELLAIVDSPRSPTALATVLGAELGVVSYHVRMLAGRGLIVLDHTQPRRGALQHFYRLAPGVVA